MALLRKPKRLEVAPEPAKPVLPLEPLKTLMEWKSASRAFKQRDRHYFTTIFIIIFVLSLILIFIREFLLIGVVLSMTFVYYVLSTVAPDEVEHKITTRGVVYAGSNYPWESLISFFFSKKYDSEILNIDTKAKLPGRLYLIIKKDEKENVRKILSKYLLEDENPKTSFFEKVSERASQKLSID